MKTTAVYPPVLRSLAAALFALLAVSCDKQETSTSQDKNSRASERRETRVTETRASRTTSSGYQWNVGDSSSYTLELGYAIGNPAKEVSPDPATQGLLIRGNYHLAVLSSDGETVTLAVTMSETQILHDGQKSPIFENLADTTPAILTLSGDGSIQQIAFPANVPQGDRQFLRAVYGLEFQMKSGTQSWTANEAGPTKTCSFLSTYTVGSNGSVIKSRRIGTEPEGVKLETLESKFVAQAGACWLESLKGREVIAISNEGKPMGETLMDLSLERTKSAARPEIAKRLLASAPQPGEFTLEPTAAADGRISASEQIRIEALRAKFADVPYDVPFKALENVADTGSHADSLPALNDFRDMLIIRPELAPLVAESLKSGVSPRLSSLLAHALELANTEATQKTLAAILANPQDYSATALSQAIVAAGGLGTLKVPAISEALDIIQSSFGDNQDEYPLSDAALFSLSRLAPANPALQQPLTDILTPLLSSANEESRCTAVLALANAELFTPELAGLAQNLFSSPEPQTRAAALSYFEGMPDLGADQIQAVTGLLKDSIVPVQLQAVATLSAAYTQNGNPQSLAALKKITTDTSASKDVREAAQTAVEAAAATAGK